jgi:hypothetical protein
MHGPREIEGQSTREDLVLVLHVVGTVLFAIWIGNHLL